MVSSAYLRLLIFLLAILIPACNSSSPVFHLMYAAYKLNKQGDNIQPCHTPFPNLNQFFHVQFCCFLTHIQVSQEAGKVIWYSHLSKNFPQFVIYRIKDFSIINEANFFFWNSLAFSRIQWMLTIWSLVPLQGLPCSSYGKESACNAGDQGSISGSRGSPGEGNGNPLHCSCLDNPRDGGACWAAVSGVTQSQTRLKRLSSSIYEL